MIDRATVEPLLRERGSTGLEHPGWVLTFCDWLEVQVRAGAGAAMATSGGSDRIGCLVLGARG